ncbi:MAG: phosphoribosylamine--glycine ligase [Candidatus Andersenbacteria bacterium]
MDRAREAALVRKIQQSPLVRRVLCTPGNDGVARECECLPIRADDYDGLVALAIKESVDLTVVGPEQPLVDGLVDRFSDEGLRVVGPDFSGAQLEGSKHFAKRIMELAGAPTAPYRVYQGVANATAAKRAAVELGVPLVVKADGLCGGKGVVVARTLEEAHAAIDSMLVAKKFGPAGATILLETCLVGQECSLMVLVDGEHAVPLEPARDYKRLGEGDTGPNTGGMGAFSPVPDVPRTMVEGCMRQIVRPVVASMKAQGMPYRGVLYVGLMLTEAGPQVLEFNCRMGDPETQVVLARMQSDLVPYLWATTDGTLQQLPPIAWSQDKAIYVVLAAEGYPTAPVLGATIELPDALPDRTDLLYAGVKWHAGKLVTSGGRVLGCLGQGERFFDAFRQVYLLADGVKFRGKRYRRDIARFEAGCLLNDEEQAQLAKILANGLVLS